MNFNFLNIPVYIHPTFWIFLLYFTNIYEDFSIISVIIGAIAFASLLIHEYGHAATAQYFGFRPTITLQAFGGTAHLNSSRVTPKQDFLITLNGPLLQSLLIVIPYYLLHSGVFGNYYINLMLYLTMRINLIWVLLNLIPVAPLDGGQLLRNILERRYGQAGYRISLLIGIISAATAAPFLFFQGFFCFGIILLIFGYQNMQVFRQIKTTSGENHPYSQYNQAVEKIKENDLENATKILKKLLKTQDPLIKKLTVESLAKIYIQQGQSQNSYNLLLKADHQALQQGKYLLCKLAFERQNYQLVANHSLAIYNIEPTFETALLNAKAFAYLNKPQLAAGWLKTASLFSPEHKAKALEALNEKPFDLLRQQDVFESVISKI